MLENGSVFSVANAKGVRNIPTVNPANPGPGQYDVPRDTMGLSSKSPLRVAYQQMQKARQ